MTIRGEGSIRLWLPLSAAILFLFFAMMSAYLDHYSSTSRLSTAIEQRIREQLHSLQVATTDFLQDGDVAGVERLLLPFAVQEDVALVVVRDPDGRIIASSHADGVDHAPFENLPSLAPKEARAGSIAMIRSDGDRYFDGVAPVCLSRPWPAPAGAAAGAATGDGLRCGEIVFRVDFLLYLTSSRTMLGNELAGVLLSTLGSTIALSLLLHWFVTSRLGAIRTAMAAFEAGNMNARVGFGRGDEIGILGNSVDRLFESVRSSAQALQERERDALRAKQEAEAANRSKSEFLANMSHEIRTPMNGILGLTDVLIHTAQSPEQHEVLRKIQSSGASLMRIINDVLDFSKIEAGALSFEKIPFNPRLVCEDTVNLFNFAGQDGMRPTISFRCDPRVPSSVMGDAVRVQQVLSNLISNAVKFTLGGRVSVSIDRVSEDSLPADTVRLLFTVADTGIGIPPEKLELIFQPFEQADGSVTRRFGGTGLGLTICKQLVDRMGGSVSVTSQVGVGSTFQIELTFRVVAQEAEAVRDGGMPLRAVAQEGAPIPPVRGHVLVVDDNDINRMVAGELLQRLGITCDFAEDGRAAVAKSAVNEYDLILMDVQMPEMDGLEATRTIRAAGQSTVPIIAFTAHAMPEDIQRVQQAGMDDHIPKPIEYPVLHAKLDKWLGRHAAAHAGVHAAVSGA